MSKEITVTANVQITAISKMSEEQYEESMEYINGFWGGLDGWKAKTAKELSDFIKEEGAPVGLLEFSDRNRGG